MASEMMGPPEVAVLLDIDEQALTDEINTVGSPVRKAYVRGLSVTNNRLRKQLLELADAGSPSAIAECRQRMQTLDNFITV